MTTAVPPTQASPGQVKPADKPVTPVANFAQRLSVSRAILAHAAALDDSSLVNVLETSIFGDLAHLLEFLHQRWVTLFGVALDDQLESTSCSLAVCVERARRTVATQEPDLCTFLTRHASHPVIQLGTRQHQALLGTGGIDLPATGW
jgi:hypothetical protein